MCICWWMNCVINQTLLDTKHVLKCVLVNKIITGEVQTSAKFTVPYLFSSLILHFYVRWQTHILYKVCSLSTELHKIWHTFRGLGFLSRYSHSLRGWTVRRSNPGWGRDFPHASRPALEPSQPPVQGVPGPSRGLKRPGHGVDHLPTSSAEIKKRVKLYIYSPYGPSWPVLGWNLFYDISFSSITRYFEACSEIYLAFPAVPLSPHVCSPLGVSL